MKTLLSATALALFGAATALAQEAPKSAITVYPFGSAPAALTVSREIAGPSARRAIEGVLESGRLSVKDETADAAVQKALDSAGTLRQWNSIVQIKRDKQMQSKYIMLGFVESAEAKPGPVKDGKRIYAGLINYTFMMIDVEQGTVADSKLVPVSSGIKLVPVPDCAGMSFGPRLSCEGKRKLAQRANDLAFEEGAKRFSGDDTPQKAIAGAVENVKEAVMGFINDAFVNAKAK